MAGLSAFKGVDTSTDAQKGALTQMLGQMGSEGANAFKADAAVAAQAAAAGRQAVIGSNPGIGDPAARSAVGSGALTQALAARAAEPGRTGSMLSTQAANDFSMYGGLLKQGNANYMDNVRAAAPIVESQTRAQVADIQAELAYKRAQLRQDAEDRALAQQQAQEDRAWELKKRGWEIDDRKAKGGVGGVQPRTASDVGSAMGLNDKQVASGLSDPVYNDLSVRAKQLIESSPEMDYNQLAGQLQAYAGGMKDADGNPIGGTHIRALALVLAQMAPLVGGTAGKHSLDVAYSAYGKDRGAIQREVAAKRAAARKAQQDRAKRNREAAAAERRRQAAALERGKSGIPASFHGTRAEWEAMDPEVRARVYLSGVSK